MSPICGLTIDLYKVTIVLGVLYSNVREIRPNRELALLTFDIMCCSKVSLESIVIPRSFSSSDLFSLICWSPMVYSTLSWVIYNNSVTVKSKGPFLDGNDIYEC